MSAASERATLYAEIKAGLAELGLSVSVDAIDSLLDYLELLSRWNTAYNLTAVRELRQMVAHHVLDSLAVAHLIRGARLADIGSGAGLPGIPLAITAPERQVTLIDANGKKTRFLREAVRSLRLSNVRVDAVRVEVASGVYDTVTARAFSALDEMLRLAGHLLAPDGVLIALKGQLHKDEILGLPAGFSIADIVPLQVPGLAAARHAVIVARSQAATRGEAA